MTLLIYRIILTVRGKTIAKNYTDPSVYRHWKQIYEHWQKRGQIDQVQCQEGDAYQAYLKRQLTEGRV
jgi:hypothetical protein